MVDTAIDKVVYFCGPADKLAEMQRRYVGVLFLDPEVALAPYTLLLDMEHCLKLRLALLAKCDALWIEARKDIPFLSPELIFCKQTDIPVVYLGQ